jgi:hypothetical protein
MESAVSTAIMVQSVIQSVSQSVSQYLILEERSVDYVLRQFSRGVLEDRQSIDENRKAR